LAIGALKNFVSYLASSQTFRKEMEMKILIMIAIVLSMIPCYFKLGFVQTETDVAIAPNDLLSIDGIDYLGTLYRPCPTDYPPPDGTP
jgi:hypothetical protein